MRTSTLENQKSSITLAQQPLELEKITMNMQGMNSPIGIWRNLWEAFLKNCNMSSPLYEPLVFPTSKSNSICPETNNHSQIKFNGWKEQAWGRGIGYPLLNYRVTLHLQKSTEEIVFLNVVVEMLYFCPFVLHFKLP